MKLFSIKSNVLFGGTEIIHTFAPSNYKRDKNESDVYTYSTMRYYYSTIKG